MFRFELKVVKRSLIRSDDSLANHDRVNEVYYGNIGTAFERITRDRIHWICKNVQGKKVLDIGCSQGITSILLGREGFTVEAIDIETGAVEFFRKELKREEAIVQSRITLIHGDALTYDFGKDSFDTAIIAEVIEHLNQPIHMAI